MAATRRRAPSSRARAARSRDAERARPSFGASCRSTCIAFGRKRPPPSGNSSADADLAPRRDRAIGKTEADEGPLQDAQDADDSDASGAGAVTELTGIQWPHVGDPAVGDSGIDPARAALFG